MDNPNEESDWPGSSSDDTSSSYRSLDNFNLSSKPRFPFSLFQYFVWGSRISCVFKTEMFFTERGHTGSHKGKHNVRYVFTHLLSLCQAVRPFSLASLHP